MTIGFVSFRKLTSISLVDGSLPGAGRLANRHRTAGVDWQGLTGVKKAAALKIDRTERCTCGCDMKVAECRMKDRSCAYSKKTCKCGGVKEVAAGKTEAVIRADLKKMADRTAAGAGRSGQDFDGRRSGARTGQCARHYCGVFRFPVPVLQQGRGGRRAYCSEQFPKDVKLVFKQFPLTGDS